MRRRLFVLAAAVGGACVGSLARADELPTGATATVSFATEGDRGVGNLFDGDPKTVMIGQANTAAEDKPVWIDIKFAEPLSDLAGVTFGESDPFKNYYPIDAEFWADSDGNGTFDTKLGVAQLGPGKESAGTRKFDGRVEKAFGLRIVVTKQNVAGLKRSFQLSEVTLVRDASAKVIAPTPDKAAPTAGAAEKADGAPAAPAQPKVVPLDESIVPNAKDLPGSILKLPEGTKIEGSVGYEKGRGPELLFDGDLSVLTNSAGGIVRDRRAGTSVTLRFPQPVANIGGIETGSSDPFRNYYPVEFEFWADSDGDGRCDTRLGSTRKLGNGADASIGRHAFDARLEKVYALEIRCVEQNVGGGGRAWMMNEMRLVTNDQLPLAKPTPNSYRVLNFSTKLPAGTTVATNVECETGKGAANLIDNDPTTFMNPVQGSANASAKPTVTLRFPAPVSGLAGLQLGQSDPFRNYVWEEMEVRADTTGSGTYDALVATISGGNAGTFKFRDAVPQAYGLELRVTKQKVGGAARAFMLSEIPGIVLRDDGGDVAMKVVVEDFEDFASWRTWGTNTGQPEGERPYGGYIYLAGALRPELAHSGKGVGLMRYNFKPGSKDYALWATRGKVNTREGIVDGISFWANPQGYDATISFEMLDARGKKIRTPGVKISGNAWQQYAIDTTGKSIPAMATAAYPIRVQNIFMNSATAGEGDILFDDITLHGLFDRGQRLRAAPVFEGIAYDPAKPLAPTYRLTSALGEPLKSTLVAKLYSSFDARRETPIATREVPVTLDAYGTAEVKVDFGAIGEGHYAAELTVEASQVSMRRTDPLAVTTLNGGRVNHKPMWFGGTHPGGWIAKPENEFVIRNVILPLGMDAYRTGAPTSDKELIDTPLLLAAGFGEVPPQLRLPSQKNDSRGEPTDYEKYYEWCKEQARQRFLPYADRILSIEFYNEPDLPNFGYLPEIDTYLKMHAEFARAFREVIPGVKIGTGGNTVQHGKEKKDFNPRMYTELATKADVAIFHAHGALENYVGRQKMVEQWLEQGGRQRGEQVIANTEAGLPSGDSPVGWLVQADNLVKKVGWAKAQPSSLYYIWFTTTDTYDPQGGYLDNENWGLVTYNQRLKPSGQAYNHLIRMLANTAGKGERPLDGRMQACAYERDDGGTVWLAWPRERGQKFLLRFAASGPVKVTDMFGGAAKTLTPVRGVVSLPTNGYPIYVEAAKGVTVGPAPAVDFVAYKDVLAVAPNAPGSIAMTVKNVWGRAVELKFDAVASKGDPLGSSTVSLAAGEEKPLTLNVVLPPGTGYGSVAAALKVTSSESGVVDETLPLTVVVAERVVRAEKFTIDGEPDAIPNASPIVVEQSTDVQDLVFDPNTPNWSGKEDLSARATLAHDDKGVYVCIDVRDQTHKPGPASDKLWIADSVQIAFYCGSAHTEIGMTESDGGFGWAWNAGDATRSAKKLDVPFAVKRKGDHTVYEAYLPYEFLGARYEPMTPIRMTFLVNEDDGRGRARILKWFDGIATGKDADRFGHLVLE